MERIWKMKISKIKLLIYFLLFTAVAAIIIMMSVEQFGGCNVVIKNKTGKNIESLELAVVDDDTIDIGAIYDGKVDANSVVKEDFEKVVLGNNNGGQLYIGIKFEGGDGKIEILEGSITKDFKGNTNVEIYEKDGKLYFDVKMATALFGSTAGTNVDESYILYPDELDYDYADLEDVDFIDDFELEDSDEEE